MAVEAMFQTVQSFQPVWIGDAHTTSYRLRDVRMLRALVLQDGLDYHLYLFLTPAKGPQDTWFQFSIQTLRDSNWTEHSNGLVRILTEFSPQKAQPGVIDRLQYPTNARLWYKALQKVGFNFGPAFQNLMQIEVLPSKRSSRVRTLWAYNGHAGNQSDYAIHPAVIDSFFQAGVAPLYRGYRTSIDSLIVPKIIDDMIIPARLGQPETTLALTGCEYTGTGREDSIPNFKSYADVYDEKTGELVFKLSGLRYSELDVSADVHNPYSYLQVSWKPDIALLTDTQLDSLALFEDDSHALEQELDLPQPCIQMLELVWHKLGSLSILEIDLESQEEDITKGVDSTSPHGTPYFSRYIYVTKTLSRLKRARDRMQHHAFTSFHMYDFQSTQEVPWAGGSTFDLIIMKVSPSPTSGISHAIDKAKSLASAHGFLLLTQSGSPLQSLQSRFDGSVAHVSCDPHVVGSLLGHAGLTAHLNSCSELQCKTGSSFVLCSARVSDHDAVTNPTCCIMSFSNDGFGTTALSKTLQDHGWPSKIWDISEAADVPMEMPVFLLDTPNSTFLRTITDEGWKNLQVLFRSGRRLIYVGSKSQWQVSSPDNSLFHGMARTLRSEDPTLKIHTLDVSSLGSENAGKAIGQILHELATSDCFLENEYCERNGIIYIPRLLRDTALIKADLEDQAGAQPQLRHLQDNMRTVRLRCERIGTLDSLHYYEVSDVPDGLRDDCIEIQIHAASLNFKDIMTSMGLVQENEYLLGLDGAGVVARIGSRVNTYQVGDRVLIHSRGCFANRVQAEPERCLSIPNGISFEVRPSKYSLSTATDQRFRRPLHFQSYISPPSTRSWKL
jgi:predicted Zn-dependent protease with MMP-like domain